MTGDPARHAGEAAEAIRSLNHATFPGTDQLRWPRDAYDVLACLALLAARLPQAFAQLDRYLTREVDAGRVAIDGGEFAGDPQAAAATASHWLEHAGALAGQLSHALDTAQQAATYAAATDPDPDDGLDDGPDSRRNAG